MKKAPSTSKSKSLLKKTSGTELMAMTSPAVKSWAFSSGIATSKEIDAMSKEKLRELYIEYLKAKGQ